MEAKFVFVLCTSALIIQSALGQCFGRMATPSRAGLGFDGFGYDGLALDGVWPRRAGCGANIPVPELAAACGGSLSVSSSSATAPTGLSVASENAYEGPVGVTGNLPFLGTAAVENVFPTAGVGAINYGCGDGAVGITAETTIDAAIAPAAIAPATVPPATVTPAGVSPAMTPWGYKSLLSRGCGCGTPSFH